MDTKNLKRPVLPAICLLLLFFVLMSWSTYVFITNVSRIIELHNQKKEIEEMIGGEVEDGEIYYDSELDSYLQAPKKEWRMYEEVDAVSSVISALLYASLLIFSLALFLKKKNGFLVFSAALYSILPIGIMALYFVRLVPFIYDIVVNKVYRLWKYGKLFFDIVIYSNKILNRIDIVGGLLWLIAAIALLVISLSAWDKIFAKPKAKKMQNILKKLFWLPAVIYLLAIPFICMPTVSQIVYHIVYAIENSGFFLPTNTGNVITILIYVGANATNVLICVITNALSFIFFLTVGLWLRNPYKKEKKSAEVTTDAAPEDDREKAVVNNCG